MKYSLRCDKCGKFIKWQSRYSWATIYSFPHGGIEGDVFRCEADTKKYGPVKSNAKPYNDDMSPYQGINEFKPENVKG